MKDPRLGNLRPASITVAKLLDIKGLILTALDRCENAGENCESFLAQTLEEISDIISDHIDF